MEDDSAVGMVRGATWSAASTTTPTSTSASTAPAVFGSTTSFTWDGARQGSILALPIALGVAIYGFSFGVLAHQKAFDLLQTMMMSMTVFSSMAQFMTLDIWHSPLPFFTIVITVFLLNLRYIVMSASLYPSFQHVPWYKTGASLFFLIDESWALSFQQVLRGRKDGAFLLGSGLTIYLAWIVSTYMGYNLSRLVQDPHTLGFDFVNILVFITLLCKANKSTKITILPLLFAGIGASLASIYLPGKWYVVIGGLVGSIVGMAMDGIRRKHL